MGLVPEFKRHIEIMPAYDQREEGLGCGCVSFRFLLGGDRGTVQFLLYSGWYLHLDRPEKPLPADLGYHSLTPQYEDQPLMDKECPYLNGKPCYYDGSGLAADGVWRRMLKEGDAGVWAALEEYYTEVFAEPAAAPSAAPEER